MSETAGFERVARADALPNGELVGVARANGERLCLVRKDGELYAVRDECTHQAFPLSAGTLTKGEGCRLECIWHGAQFDLPTGAVLKGPAEAPLTRYEVREEEGWVWVGRAAQG